MFGRATSRATVGHAFWPDQTTFIPVLSRLCSCDVIGSDTAEYTYVQTGIPRTASHKKHHGNEAIHK